MRSIADIERRGRRLFGADDAPDTQVGLAAPGSASTRSAGQRTSPKKKRKPQTLDARPPHARNPYRVGTMADIKARSRRLFDASGPVDPARLVKLPSIKPLLVNRRASTVAAYFTRQAEQNHLMPAQRSALRRMNKQYFDLRRSVFSDSRLTRQDKAQLVSVLTFERLKAREAIQNPQYNTEVSFMGSAEIRKLIKDDEQIAPAFSITGPGGPGYHAPEPEPIRVRAKRVLDNLSKRLDPADKERDLARERELNAKDLYTRKAKFTQNVHYLDKHTDKTLFVDTGKAIVMRRTGITEPAVAVALQLAKERFGSTLSINGSPEFKKLVVEAAAKHGIDVHFTDKNMNQALSERRAELEIEQEGQGIAQPTVVELKVAQAAAAGTPGAVSQPAAGDMAPVSNDLVAMDTKWWSDLDLTEEDIASSDVAMGVRGDFHANWLVGYGDNSPQAVDLIRKCMEDDSYRDSFKRVIEDLYALPTNSAQDIAALDAVTGFVEDLVNEVEGRKYQESQQSPGANQTDRKLIVGTLVDHGAAPYQHNEKNRDKPPSYFVTLKLDSGESRTLWGVGLGDAMNEQHTALKPGDRISLTDLGTVPVKVPVPQADGQVVEKVVQRRSWDAELLVPGKARAVETQAPTVVKQPIESPQVSKPADPVVDLVQPSKASDTAGTAAVVTAVAIATAGTAIAEQTSDTFTVDDGQELDIPSAVSDVAGEADIGTDPRSAEDWAPVETYTDVYVQVEEEGPEMD